MDYHDLERFGGIIEGRRVPHYPMWNHMNLIVDRTTYEALELFGGIKWCGMFRHVGNCPDVRAKCRWEINFQDLAFVEYAQARFRLSKGMLYACCVHGAGEGVIPFLVSLFPEAVREPDETGHLPIHYAMKFGGGLGRPQSRDIEALLDAYPESLMVFPISERAVLCPLMSCLHWNYSAEVVDRLFERFKEIHVEPHVHGLAIPSGLCEGDAVGLRSSFDADCVRAVARIMPHLGCFQSRNMLWTIDAYWELLTCLDLCPMVKTVKIPVPDCIQSIDDGEMALKWLKRLAKCKGRRSLELCWQQEAYWVVENFLKNWDEGAGELDLFTLGGSRLLDGRALVEFLSGPAVPRKVTLEEVDVVDEAVPAHSNLCESRVEELYIVSGKEPGCQFLANMVSLLWQAGNLKELSLYYSDSAFFTQEMIAPIWQGLRQMLQDSDCKLERLFVDFSEEIAVYSIPIVECLGLNRTLRFLDITGGIVDFQEMTALLVRILKEKNTSLWGADLVESSGEVRYYTDWNCAGRAQAGDPDASLADVVDLFIGVDDHARLRLHSSQDASILFELLRQSVSIWSSARGEERVRKRKRC